MTESYGPDDATIPAWEAPTGAPIGAPAARTAPAPVGAAAPSGTYAHGLPTYRSWQPGFMPLRPLTLGDFITLPMQAITFNRAVLVGGPLLCTIATFAVLAGAGWMVLVDYGDALIYGARFDGFRAETIVFLSVALLAYLVADAAARCVITPGVSRAVLGERLTLGQAWALARPRIPHLLLLYFYGFLLLCAGTLLLALLGMAAPILAPLVFIALVVAWVYGAVAFGVAANAVILEGGGAAAAIRRGLTLVKGNVWRLIGISIVIGIILYFVAAMIGGITQVPLLLAASSGVSLTTYSIIAVFSLLVSQLLSSVLSYSYLGTVATLIYVDLRIRQEGFDVELARAAEARSAR